MSVTNILLLFTRTPLHVGAGSSVGAIDQPVIRERHTGFPIIPGSALKGCLADEWNDELHNQAGEGSPRRLSRIGKNREISDAAWLFGSDSDKLPMAGALQFAEAKLLAFPVRSARGCFAWITCPLALRRAARDGVISQNLLNDLPQFTDDLAVFDTSDSSPISLEGTSVVIEEYVFNKMEWAGLPALGEALGSLVPDDLVWAESPGRIIILSDGMMSFFATNACEVAQHVKINDETGTQEPGALFNQENVPSETLFYSVIQCFDERKPKEANDDVRRSAAEAVAAFHQRISTNRIYQFGGDASTGLGYCSLNFKS